MEIYLVEKANNKPQAKLRILDATARETLLEQLFMLIPQAKSSGEDCLRSLSLNTLNCLVMLVRHSWCI